MPTEKVIVITGGSSGIGAATARQAVNAGHRVVLAASSTRSRSRPTLILNEVLVRPTSQTI